MSGWRIHRRSACRICGAAAPRRVLRFERMPFTDEFVTAERRGREFVADLDVHVCETCGVVQTQHDVEIAEYYRDYTYTVSSSGFAREFMSRLAEAARRWLDLRPGDRVLEVGSGDGFQLGCFAERGLRVLGFEPSEPLVEVARRQGVDTIVGLFDRGAANRIPADFLPVQCVLLTYTFDHLPDPLAMLDTIRSILDPQRGVLIIEVHGLGRIVERCETCLFEHEHAIYLDRATATSVLACGGFRVLDIELVPEPQRRGNSLLLAATPEGAAWTADWPAACRLPPRDPTPDLHAFARDVAARLGGLREHVRRLRAAGRRVAGYGAGGRGVMTLAQAGLTAADIAYLCDQNPCFHGLLTPATHVPVAPPQRLRDDPVDEVIVFSYGYLAEIRAALADVAARGTRFVSMLDLLRGEA
ncbi:MAG: methyltransferase domain-containing protein [Phycisphaerales bacterium]|nr:methyltransferase domain-containing protein [Phycisphaerales bacterium]